ncbi:MAG: hypothetical protein MJZ34_11305 [Paludibacteraceae bacterium]|nr:hypothetical protein [Paludibacteraceae bacterium]
MAKWSNPGLSFREIDNSVVNNSGPTPLGRGAIVLNSNRGYPNQRILSTNLNEFYENFGEPDNPNQYGKFAASQFFQAGSQSLLAVRATQGDEQYAFLQVPYNSIDITVTDMNSVSGLESYRYVNKDAEDVLKLIYPTNQIAASQISGYENAGWEVTKQTQTVKINGMQPFELEELEKITPYWKLSSTDGDDTTNEVFVNLEEYYKDPTKGVYEIADIMNSKCPDLESETVTEYTYENSFVFSGRGSIGAFNDVFDNSESTFSVIYRTDSSNTNESAKMYDFYSPITQSRCKISVKSEYQDSIIPVIRQNENAPSNMSYIKINSANTAYGGDNVTLRIQDLMAENEKQQVANYYINSGMFDELVEVPGSIYSGVALTALVNSENMKFVTIEEEDRLAGLDDSINVSSYYETYDIRHFHITDWQDMETKDYYVKEESVTATSGTVSAISFVPEGESLSMNVLSTCYRKYPMDSVDAKVAAAFANELGLVAEEVTNKNFELLLYINAYNCEVENDEGEIVNASNDPNVSNLVINAPKPENVSDIINSDVIDYRIIKKNAVVMSDGTLDSLKESKYIFSLYQIEKAGKPKLEIVSHYVAETPNAVQAPWQIDKNNKLPEGVKKANVTSMEAMSSIEVFGDPYSKYVDGFTPTTDTEDEPGNGDIEEYVSNQGNQLVIAALGPGEYANTIGISIISPEAAMIPALDSPNAFNWKYTFDDEDKVELASNDYRSNMENLTWKKVYRINVYNRPKDKGEDYWGSGLDALVKEPDEWFLVSNDPDAKDGDGNSLYAPNVINGHSRFIYVSKNSVSAAKNSVGGYDVPIQTYSIYSLQGGKNSKLNNIKEKTAALNLYKERQYAAFDILFNVEPIDTFQSKQKYRAHQNKIAEIASTRGLDIAAIQVTSKAAKSGRQMLSEAKSFSFANGSYVAAYCGYDKYYDSYTGTWCFIPLSVAGACAMCRCDIYAYPWYAPAGMDNGGIGYSNGSIVKLSDKELGALYDANTNGARNCTGHGQIVWHQKTMLKKDSALNRINVRRLVNYIENRLEVILVPYLYKHNTQELRESIRTTVDAFLSRIQTGQGILWKDVKVVTDRDDPHLLYVNLDIVPAEVVEHIQVTTTVSRNNGLYFTEG